MVILKNNLLDYARGGWFTCVWQESCQNPLNTGLIENIICDKNGINLVDFCLNFFSKIEVILTFYFHIFSLVK